MGKELLNEVPRENYFFVKGGEIIKSMEELPLAIELMDEETYKFHANEQKNDFCNWVLYTIKDEKLARELKGKNKKEAVKTSIKRVKEIRRMKK